MKPSVGVAIIAKDAAATIDACLKSIKPYVSQIVVCVDQRTTDRTRQIAKRNGAETYPIKVSDWHECQSHGRVLAQHFAAARQESFTHLDPDLDWWCWIDSDDILLGGETLAAQIVSMPEDSAGMWWPYEYAGVVREDGQYRCNTMFHRERLLRTKMNGQPINWTWHGRVHETVSPDVETRWVVTEDIRVRHQPGTHSTPSSAARNLLLLEIDFEEDPDSARTIFYMGNQHFAMGNWQEAVNWYELLTSGVGENPYELWQAYIYMSLAYERLGNADGARGAAFGAMDVRPEHPEPYYRLAAIANLCGEFDKALSWTKMGRQQAPPPFFVFKNPLDYSFNQRVVAGEAFMHLGRITDARREWEEAEKVFTDERLAGALTDVRQREKNMAAAQGFVEIAKRIDGQAFDVYKTLPEEVKSFSRTRDLVMPPLLRERISSSPRIVFYCGGSWEPWYPGSINTTGIGGSETAVIEIARRFAADGWTVDVYNGADRYEGIHDGVGYWDQKRFDQLEEMDVYVSWRGPMMVPPSGAKKALLWCHDLNYGPGAAAGFEMWSDRGVIAGVSQWHAEMLRRYYGVKAVSLPNGINLDRFDPWVKHPERDDGLLTQTASFEPIRKIPFRCVYASSADRGLLTLLRLWPEIVKMEPTAELHVAYGWETIDRMIAGGRDELVPFKAQVEREIAEAPNVVWRGRLAQSDLAQLYGESVAWLSPTDFLEVSCISAMEAMAGGAVPITTACGALPETIGVAGLLVPGPTTSRPYRDNFVRIAMGVLSELNTQKIYELKGRARARELTWDHAYRQWLAVLGLESTPTEYPERAEKVYA